MMLYEVLTGKTPFDTENEFELMKLQTEVTPPSPRELNPAIPEAVEAAIMRSIEKDPENRFQTAGEFRETLLDAGFSASGAMRGVTGTHTAKAGTRPSSPALSQPGTPPAKSKDAPKATRLGEATSAPSAGASAKATRLGVPAAAQTAKATRLGTMNAAAENTPAQTATQESFFSKLTVVHYAGAGIAAVVLLGILIAVPFMSSGKNTADDAKTVPEAVKPAEKPAIIEAPRTEQPIIRPSRRRPQRQPRRPPARAREPCCPSMRRPAA
jgi:serine/threonine-protein kinase